MDIILFRPFFRTALFSALILVLCFAFPALATPEQQENADSTKPQTNDKPPTIVTEREDDKTKPSAGEAIDSLASLVVPYLAETVTLDGILDEDVWNEATKVPLTFVTRPFENTAPPVQTTARIFENGETIYIAFTAQDDDPSLIRALFRDRDNVWDDDLVGIKIDTFGDSRLSYQFFVNPHGIQSDAIENQMTLSESDSWNAIWDAEAQITDEGYTVEIALPFRIMNFLDSDGPKQWRAEFVRFYPRDNNLRISNRPVDRDNACGLCQMGKMEGFAAAQQGKNLSITPYAVAGFARNRQPAPNDNWQYQNN